MWTKGGLTEVEVRGVEELQRELLFYGDTESVGK